MKYYKMIFIILSILLVQSCYVIHNSTAKEFTYCYNKSKTGIDKLIDISGYYEIDYISSENIIDRKEMVVFFEDGIYFQSSCIDYYLNSTSGINKKCMIKNCDLGVYKIYGDTIKVRYIYVGSATSGCTTVMYKIIDKKTIKRIFSGNCSKNPKEFHKNYDVSNAKFISLKNLPNPYSNKLIKRKWFWCDKQEYKERKRSPH